MFNRNFAEGYFVTNLYTNQPINTGTNTVVTTAINMAGFQEVAFVLMTPALNLANTPVMSALYGTASNTCNTVITGSTMPFGANTTVQILDLPRLSKQFAVASVFFGGTVNTTFSLLAIQSGRELPTGAAPGGYTNTNNFMVNVGGTANTTTLEFTGTMAQQSQANTPTSILLLPNA